MNKGSLWTGLDRMKLRLEVLGTGANVRDLNPCMTPVVLDARSTGEIQVKVLVQNRAMIFHCQAIVSRRASPDSPKLALKPALAQRLGRDVECDRQLGNEVMSDTGIVSEDTCEHPHRANNPPGLK
jgi:hypothetical protein